MKIYVDRVSAFHLELSDIVIKLKKMPKIYRRLIYVFVFLAALFLLGEVFVKQKNEQPGDIKGQAGIVSLEIERGINPESASEEIPITHDTDEVELSSEGQDVESEAADEENNEEPIRPPKDSEPSRVQVITPAISPIGECKEFPTPCDVPSGWQKVDSCLSPAPSEPQNPYDKLAKCLNEKGIKLYGASWCSHCQSQKDMFGESAKYLPYVECSTPQGGQAQICKDAGIMAYPTWILQDGTRKTGELSFEQISQYSGCRL